LRVSLRLPGEYGCDELAGSLFSRPKSGVEACFMRDEPETAGNPFKEHR
jgi:hypothetical protein